ncbi:MAG TPA: cytochrome c [Lamprocystis sp. (in: g-proteobacteria)]|nr:cytochrome c [Lamprocystis sp. (in: g-proteobacteria)]
MTLSPIRIALALPFALALALTTPLAAKEAAVETPNAQALYTQHCVKCHQSEVYTRPDRKITGLAPLNAQVHRCESMLELRWFDEEVDAVTAYLNDQYYHFKP